MLQLLKISVLARTIMSNSKIIPFQCCLNGIKQNVVTIICSTLCLKEMRNKTHSQKRVKIKRKSRVGKKIGFLLVKAYKVTSMLL